MSRIISYCNIVHWKTKHGVGNTVNVVRADPMFGVVLDTYIFVYVCCVCLFVSIYVLKLQSAKSESFEREGAENSQIDNDF